MHEYVVLVILLPWIADDLVQGWERAHFANPSHIPRSIMRFARETKFLDSTKRPSVFTVRRQFSALRVWMTCTTWVYKVFPTVVALVVLVSFCLMMLMSLLATLLTPTAGKLLHLLSTNICHVWEHV